MKDNLNIDEMLNSLIDDELPSSQRTEVEQLISSDVEIAARFRELKRCKSLVSSLPGAQAPAGLLGDIKTALERRALLGTPAGEVASFDERKGARHLMFRRVMAAAAMIALVALLGSVVYTIIAPEDVGRGPVAVEDLHRPKKIEITRPVPAEVEVTGAEKTVAEVTAPGAFFAATVELKTSNLVAADAFINKAIEENDLLAYSDIGIVKSEGDRSVYTLNCTKQALSLLLSDLSNAWSRFDSTTLFVETEGTDEKVVVEAVSLAQIAEIATQDNLEDSVTLAEDYAVLNNISERLPGKEILVAIEDTKEDFLTIPKPVLTSSERTVKQTAPISRTEKETIQLTIVLSSIE